MNMRLETKASLLIVCVLLLIGSLHLYIHWGIVYPGFRDIEEQSAAKHLQQCKDALNRELYHLDVLVSDWAYWDDTYQFVASHNSDFIKTNLTDETFANSRLDLLYIFNDRREVVYGRLYGIDETLREAVHQQILSLCETFFADESVKGIVNSPAAPTALASRSIHTSSQDGPCRGRLIMGRLIDENMILQLSKQMHVPLSLIPYETAKKDKQTIIDSLTSSGELFEIRSRQQMIAYAALSDINGNPAFLLEMDQLRQITQAGKITLAYSLIPTLAIMACTFFVCLYFIEHHLIRPVNAFSMQMRSIRKTRDFSERVTLPREPEIRQMATEFNRLMRRLSLYNNKRNDAESRLRDAVCQADYANRSKSAFLASMSHEIRTPMNAILGFSELLRDEMLTDEQKEYVDIIQTNSRLLLELINDILDLSKIEAGKLIIEQADCLMNEQLKAVEILMRQTAQQRGLEFGISIAKDCPQTVHADPLRLRQCLINLVGNAIKFTVEGHVFINVYVDKHSDGEFICIAVEDTGIGISKDRQDAIFEAFTQSDSSTSRCFGGTGLGLTITKKLVELMQGQLLLQSELGKGSVFTVSLPVRQTTPQTFLEPQQTNA